MYSREVDYEFLWILNTSLLLGFCVECSLKILSCGYLSFPELITLPSVVNPHLPDTQADQNNPIGRIYHHNLTQMNR